MPAPSASKGWSRRRRSGWPGCTGCCCSTPSAVRSCRPRSAAPWTRAWGCPAPGTLRRATELAGLGPDAAGPAERGRLIELVPDLRFRHPIIRAAAYDGASERARRQAHGVLAAAARALDDQQAAAWHLAVATPAPAEDVAAGLEAAAAAAHD